MKILLAIDGSPYTKKMLAYLVEHKELFSGTGQQYTALTVMAPLPTRASSAVGKEVVLQYYADEADRIMQPVLKFLARHDIKPDVRNKVGAPADLIARTAQDGKYDLVIMGSHGHNALGNLVMGSVATKVLAQCSVPVLLVR